jgi:hypothetical protein
MVLGPTKTAGTAGRQLLSPTVIERLHRRQGEQDEFRKELPGAWPSVVYQGERLDLIFTNPDGRMMLRQHVDRAIRQAAVKAGLDPNNLGTHTGRRSVVTNPYASGSLDAIPGRGWGTKQRNRQLVPPWVAPPDLASLKCRRRVGRQAIVEANRSFASAGNSKWPQTRLDRQICVARVKSP